MYYFFYLIVLMIVFVFFYCEVYWIVKKYFKGLRMYLYYVVGLMFIIVVVS